MTSETFHRNSRQRASCSALKQPRLPGAERFKFTTSSDDLRGSGGGSIGGQIPQQLQQQHPELRYDPRSSLHHHRQVQADGFAPRTNTLLRTLPSKTDRRKPIIPISKQTSNILNNTNVELSMETIEVFPRNDSRRITQLCRDYIINGVVTSRSLNHNGRASTISSAPSCSGLSDSSDSGWSSPPPPIKPRNLPSSSRTPSPTISVCSSSDSDVWVLRTDITPTIV